MESNDIFLKTHLNNFDEVKELLLDIEALNEKYNLSLELHVTNPSSLLSDTHDQLI